MEHGNRYLPAHQKGHRNTDTKRADDPLYHDKPRHANTVEKTGKAKQEARQQAVDRIRFQIFSRSRDHFCIVGKNEKMYLTADQR